MPAAKSKGERPAPLRVKIEDDLAAAVRQRVPDDKHGARASLVNYALRKKFEELGWIEPLLKPAEPKPPKE